MADLVSKRDKLLKVLESLQSCGVAFSAGVDSTVVAKAAHLALGNRAVAMTGDSKSLASGELDEASQLCKLIGIRHVVIATNEFASSEYTRNAPDRCFHCKDELYSKMATTANELGLHVLVNGANTDDIQDYRPGMQAAKQHAVCSPLIECGINKAQVRELARYWELPIWDKPAAPCLSSRVAYGEEVTAERLKMIDLAEQFLRSHGFPLVRIRYHRGDVARIEIPVELVSRICEEPFRSKLVDHLRKIGFKYSTVDLEGFRSGSMNRVLPVEELKQW